ncbi:EVE domain-containing protein [Megalodesulfovibrio paquesii]
MPAYWLVKTEPGCFSIEDLASSENKTTCWSGVRNYQARNFMRQMQLGDPVLFYHSITNPGIVGLAAVVREAYPDHTAFDADDQHYDPKSTPAHPIWDMVDLQWRETFPTPLPLAQLRQVRGLEGMELLRKGSRLSVMPVAEAEYLRIMELAHQ